jgi:CheY-like chemotaxis protein
MLPCRVLVVDDNTRIHRDFHKIVDPHGHAASWAQLAADPLAELAPAAPPDFEVSFASSGEAALKLVQAAAASLERYHVAIVDVRMPGLDGLATVEQLWRVQPELEVAFSSAYMDYSWNAVVERLQRPGLRLLPKPWMASQVLAVLHELRGRARVAKAAEPTRAPSLSMRLKGATR